MPSINFRERRFNAVVDHQIKHIYDLIYVHQHFNEANFQSSLGRLLDELNYYYRFERPDYSIAQMADERACEVFSEFCQNLIYYIAHNARDHAVARRALECVMAQPLFFYVKRDGQITIWIDPKEHYTVLNSAVRFGEVEILRKLFVMADAANRNRHHLLHDLMLVENKEGFSLLNSAAHDGNIEMVRELLANAEFIFGGRQSAAFAYFLDHRDVMGYTPLNSVCRAACKVAHNADYEKIARLLLQYGADPGRVNIHGKSPLDNAPRVWQLATQAQATESTYRP